MSERGASSPLRVAVFGSSEPRPGEPVFELARETGRRLAARRATVVTGGYGGVMEGASRGAREAGGRTLGVVCTRVFSRRAPNPYLDETLDRPDLLARTASLIDLSDGFIILPGRAGTLAEIAWLWALHRAGVHDRPRVVLGDDWRGLLEALRGLGVLEPSLLEATPLAPGPDEAVDGVLARIRANGGTAP